MKADQRGRIVNFWKVTRSRTDFTGSVLRSCLLRATRFEGSRPFSADPHHPVAGVVVGLLKLILDCRDLDLEADPSQAFADRFDVRGPATVEVQQREDADLAGHPQ